MEPCSTLRENCCSAESLRYEPSVDGSQIHSLESYDDPYSALSCVACIAQRHRADDCNWRQPILYAYYTSQTRVSK